MRDLWLGAFCFVVGSLLLEVPFDLTFWEHGALVLGVVVIAVGSNILGRDGEG